MTLEKFVEQYMPENPKEAKTMLINHDYGLTEVVAEVITSAPLEEIQEMILR